MKKILLIDDDVAVLKLLKLAFTEEGFSVSTALDGKSALEQMASVIPDLIITDVMMPKVGGLELVRAVKSKEEMQRIPIILLTSLKKYDDMKSGYNLGADLYVSKPFDLAKLIKNAKALLGGRLAGKGGVF